MKKTSMWIFTGIALVLAAVIAVFCLARDKDPNNWTANTNTPEHGKLELLATEDGMQEDPLSTLAPSLGEDPSSTDIDIGVWIPDPTPDAPTESSPSNQETAPTAPPDTTPDSTENNSTTPEPPPETQPPATEPPFLALPYKIPNTDLVLGRLDSYAGTFLEQGTDTKTENVAMILLRNNGQEALELGILTVTLEDGTVLEFKPTCLPAGGKMVVQEQSGKAYFGGNIQSCVGETATLTQFPMSTNQVKVTENADSSITVTNITIRKIPAVRIFYKLYIAEQDGYVGGITYMAKVTNLAPGASTTLRPSHYLYGSCQVVMVRTYDVAD